MTQIESVIHYTGFRLEWYIIIVTLANFSTNMYTVLSIHNYVLYVYTFTEFRGLLTYSVIWKIIFVHKFVHSIMATVTELLHSTNPRQNISWEYLIILIK